MPSADKHGIAREDAVNAMLSFEVHRSPFGPSRVGGRGAPDLWIGPGLDGVLLEVLAERTTVVLVVLHVMAAWRKIIEAARREHS